MSIRIGIGVTMRCGGSTAESLALPVIQDGHTIGWYDSRDLTTITKDVNEHVTVWKNKLLVALTDLDIVGGTPHWSTDGILFDGVGDYLRAGAGITFGQPMFYYLVIKQIARAYGNRICDGISTNWGGIYQSQVSPQLRAQAGAASDPVDGLTMSVLGIVTVLFNGADSMIQVNDGTPVTGNFGAAPANGITLGCSGDLASFSNILVAEDIRRNNDDRGTNATLIKNYLKAKYSI